MSQFIVNPEKRDPSNIRNKAELGLSKVDNLSASELINLTSSVAKNKIYKGNIFAKEEIKNGIKFEIPLCMFTERATKLSIVISFVNDLEVVTGVTANIIYSLSSEPEKIQLNYELFGEYINLESFPAYLTLYKGDNSAVLSLICESGLNVYNITGVSFNIIDYIIISNGQEDHLNFRYPSGSPVLTDTNIGSLAPSSSSENSSNYYFYSGSRQVSDFTRSLPVYEKNTGVLVYDNNINSNISFYQFPTINEVPFTGSKDILSGSTRNITINAMHKDSTLAGSGSHRWEVLEDTPVVIKSDSTQSGSVVVHKSREEAESGGFGLCKVAGEKLYQKTSVSSNSYKELNSIRNSINQLGRNYDESVVSVGLLRNYLTTLCNILSNYLETSGELSIKFDNKDSLTDNFTYFSISPIVGRITTIYYELKCLKKTSIVGVLEENQEYFQLINSDGYEVDEITLHELNSGESEDTTEETVSGRFSIKTIKFPPLDEDRTFGKTVLFKIFRSGESDPTAEEVATYGLHLRSLSSDNVFIDTLASNIIFNPIVLTRACVLDEQEGRIPVFEKLQQISNSEYQYSFFNANSEKIDNSSFLWKKISSDSNSNNIITSYGVILPPREYNTILKTGDSTPWKRYLLLEGYSLSRYFRVTLNIPSKKTVQDYFSNIEILLPQVEGTSTVSYYTKSFNSSSEIIVDILEKTPDILSSNETHEYNNFIKDQVIFTNKSFASGFSDENGLEYFKFYLKLTPKNATHLSSNFDTDVLNNISINIVPINEEIVSGNEEYTDVPGNNLIINFSQVKLPLVIKEFDFDFNSDDFNDSFYGVHSKMNFNPSNDPSLTILNSASTIQKEQLKLPFKLRYSEEDTGNDEIGLDNDKKILSSLDLRLNQDDLIKFTTNTIRSSEAIKMDGVDKIIVDIYRNYLKITLENAKYSHSTTIDAEYPRFCFLKNLELTTKFLTEIYSKLNKSMWLNSNLADNYPKGLLPESKIKETQIYSLDKKSNQVDIKDTLFIRKKNIVFSLQRMGVSNYCGINGMWNGASSVYSPHTAPAIFLHYRQQRPNSDSNTGYTVENERFEDNTTGNEMYYDVDCWNRTWGGSTQTSTDWINITRARRMSNYLTRFGFAFNLSANFEGDIKIISKLSVVAPKFKTEENKSDATLGISDYQKIMTTTGNLYWYSSENIIKEKDRLEKYVTKAFPENENYYNWEMYQEVNVKVAGGDAYKPIRRYLSDDYDKNDNKDQYDKLREYRSFKELTNKGYGDKILSFYPQCPYEVNSSDLKKHKYDNIDPWFTKNTAPKYSVLNLHRFLVTKNPPTSLSDEIVWASGHESTNDHNTAWFPQTLSLFREDIDDSLWDKAVRTFPRMTAFRPVTEPTTLTLELHFYQEVNGNLIPIDVNNGIDNNKLTFKFDLWPQGHIHQPGKYDGRYGKLDQPD